MKILSIGNSFSQDAQRYLHGVAEERGIPVKAINLYIGGCPLSLHHRHLLSGARAYDLQVNGHSSGFSVSIQEALLSDDFDAVTLQQVSQLAPHYDTYQPYLSVLAEEVRRLCPKATVYMHQVWAYEDASDRLHQAGFATHAQMLAADKEACARAAADIRADIIPCGKTMENLVQAGVPAHRDTFHASLGVGRYALALTFLGRLTHADVRDSRFDRFDVPVSPQEAEAARCAAAAALALT